MYLGDRGEESNRLVRTLDTRESLAEAALTLPKLRTGWEASSRLLGRPECPRFLGAFNRRSGRIEPTPLYFRLLEMAADLKPVMIGIAPVREQPLPYPTGSGQCASDYVQSGPYCAPKNGRSKPAIPEPSG